MEEGKWEWIGSEMEDSAVQWIGQLLSCKDDTANTPGGPGPRARVYLLLPRLQPASPRQNRERPMGQGDRLPEDVPRKAVAFREPGDKRDELGRHLLEYGRLGYRTSRDRAGRAC